MDHPSPLPFCLVAGLFGGLLLAGFILLTGGGFWWALLGYSLGGALTLVLTAALVTLRVEPEFDT